MVRIICDACEADLAEAGRAPKFRLTLACEELEHKPGGMIHAVRVYPPIDREYHFCNLNCLSDWLASR